MKTFKEYKAINEASSISALGATKEQINEKNIVNKKQLQWMLKMAKEADNLNSLIEDIELMIQMEK